jgi:hypothetical protein
LRLQASLGPYLLHGPRGAFPKNRSRSGPIPCQDSPGRQGSSRAESRRSSRRRAPSAGALSSQGTKNHSGMEGKAARQRVFSTRYHREARGTCSGKLSPTPQNMENRWASPVASASGIRHGKTRGADATPLANPPFVPHLKLCGPTHKN